MLKSVISALSLATALAIAAPAFAGTAATNTGTDQTQPTQTAPAAMKKAPAVCHASKTHKCPAVHHHHKKKMMKKAKDPLVVSNTKHQIETVSKAVEGLKQHRHLLKKELAKIRAAS